VPSRAGLLCWTILLRLQQDEFWTTVSTWFTTRHAVANRIPARTVRFPAKNLLKQKKLEWIIPIGRCARRQSIRRRVAKKTRLDCSAGGRLAETEVGGDVRAAGGNGPRYNGRSAVSGAGRCDQVMVGDSAVSRKHCTISQISQGVYDDASEIKSWAPAPSASSFSTLRIRGAQ
jgi:hypothetical protein